MECISVLRAMSLHKCSFCKGRRLWDFRRKHRSYHLLCITAFLMSNCLLVLTQTKPNWIQKTFEDPLVLQFFFSVQERMMMKTDEPWIFPDGTNLDKMCRCSQGCAPRPSPAKKFLTLKSKMESLTVQDIVLSVISAYLCLRLYNIMGRAIVASMKRIQARFVKSWIRSPVNLVSVYLFPSRVSLTAQQPRILWHRCKAHLSPRVGCSSVCLNRTLKQILLCFRVATIMLTFKKIVIILIQYNKLRKYFFITENAEVPQAFPLFMNNNNQNFQSTFLFFIFYNRSSNEKDSHAGTNILRVRVHALVENETRHLYRQHPFAL